MVAASILNMQRGNDMQRKSHVSRFIALLFAMLLLASCGGGGGTAATPAPAAPTTLSWDQTNWDAVNWQ